jgi:hypothetical protein
MTRTEAKTKGLKEGGKPGPPEAKIASDDHKDVALPHVRAPNKDRAACPQRSMERDKKVVRAEGLVKPETARPGTASGLRGIGADPIP